jgi:precorrin-6B methylase 2
MKEGNMSAESVALGLDPKKTTSIESFLNNPPLLHTWDGGETWNTGGFGEAHLRPLISLIRNHVRQGPTILETGSGCSTIAFLLVPASRVISISPEGELHRRISRYCDEHAIPAEGLEFHEGFSEWILPQISMPITSQPFVDFALIDGGHGWPTPFIDFFYINYMLRQNAFVMIDDVQLYSTGELARFLTEQPGFDLELDLGKSLIFKKATSDRTLPEWNGQPYIVKRSQ